MPACSTCEDTHRMPLRDGIAMCTRCPLPCRLCASHGGRGAYCEQPACSCLCHKPAGIVSPISRGFTHEVRMYVAIPRAWAHALKLASRHHYDGVCRMVGDAGVVNALYNTALFADAEDPPSPFPVSWRDLDTITKVAEQLEYHTNDHAMIAAIRRWLRESMDAIANERNRCGVSV